MSFSSSIAGEYSIALDHVDGLFTGTQDIFYWMSLQVQKTNLKTGAALFAASRLGSSNTMGNLEEEDVANAGKPIAGMPIDDYLWILALICLIYVFMKLRTSQKNEIQI